MAPGVCAHLAPGDIHEHSKAGGVAALAGHVGPVPGQQLTALGRPTSSPTGAAEKRGVRWFPPRPGSPRPSCPLWGPGSILTVPNTSTSVIRSEDRSPAPPGAWGRVNTLPSLSRLARAANGHPVKFTFYVSSAVKLKQDVSGPPQAPFVGNISPLLKQPLCTSVFF